MRHLCYFILLALSIFQPLKSQNLDFNRTLRADFIFLAMLTNKIFLLKNSVLSMGGQDVVAI